MKKMLLVATAILVSVFVFVSCGIKNQTVNDESTELHSSADSSVLSTESVSANRDAENYTAPELTDTYPAINYEYPKTWTDALSFFDLESYEEFSTRYYKENVVENYLVDDFAVLQKTVDKNGRILEIVRNDDSKVRYVNVDWDTYTITTDYYEAYVGDIYEHDILTFYPDGKISGSSLLLYDEEGNLSDIAAYDFNGQGQVAHFFGKDELQSLLSQTLSEGMGSVFSELMTAELF